MKYGLMCLLVLPLLGACSDDEENNGTTTSGTSSQGGSGASGGQGGAGASGGGASGGMGGAATGGMGGAPIGPVVLNEVAADGNPEDWIELKNVSNSPVDISGWYFTDDDPTHIYVFPAGTEIAAGEYLTVDRAGEGGAGGAGPDEFDFGFSNDGDEAHLYDDGDVELDSTTWAVPIVDPATWARSPDGSGDFALSAQGTKGAANQ
jgi:hypothetical protein